MNDSNKEQLSALIDDEVPLADMDSVRREPEFIKTWQSYHLIRDAIKDELSTPSAFNLADRVSLALADEPVVFAPNALAAPVRRRWLKPLAGLAIAASVAAISVVGMQWLKPTAEPVLAANVPAPVEVNTGLASQDDPAEQQRLKEYLIEHSQQSIHQGNNRVVPYVQAASFQEKK